MLKFPCLVLDHDDTVVQSETTINYPYFCYILDKFRPGQTMTLEDYVLECHRLGFAGLCKIRFGFTEEEVFHILDLSGMGKEKENVNLFNSCVIVIET